MQPSQGEKQVGKLTVLEPVLFLKKKTNPKPKNPTSFSAAASLVPFVSTKY